MSETSNGINIVESQQDKVKRTADNIMRTQIAVGAAFTLGSAIAGRPDIGAIAVGVDLASLQLRVHERVAEVIEDVRSGNLKERAEAAFHRWGDRINNAVNRKVDNFVGGLPTIRIERVRTKSQREKEFGSAKEAADYWQQTAEILDRERAVYLDLLTKPVGEKNRYKGDAGKAVLQTDAERRFEELQKRGEI